MHEISPGLMCAARLLRDTHTTDIAVICALETLPFVVEVSA